MNTLLLIKAKELKARRLQSAQQVFAAIPRHRLHLGSPLPCETLCKRELIQCFDV